MLQSRRSRFSQYCFKSLYLYHGQNELGAFSATGTPINLKIPGLTALPVSIECKGQIFAPILDTQNNIRRVIDLNKNLVESDDFTAFGQPIDDSPKLNPWRFACKRLDPELGLVYFGKRYYDPELGRWLTTDPAGFMDGFYGTRSG